MSKISSTTTTNYYSIPNNSIVRVDITGKVEIITKPTLRDKFNVIIRTIRNLF